MRAIIAALLVMAAACAAPAGAPTPPVQPPQQGADTCGLSRHANLIGVHESDIDRSQLPQGARVICPTCLVTQDYSAERLNLFTSTEGRVASMRCG